MKHVAIDGEFVHLAPLSLDHLEDLERDFKPHLFDYYPKPYATAREFVEENLEMQNAGNLLPFAIVDKRTGEAIGCTEYSSIDDKNRKLEIGGSWIKPELQGSVANSETKLLLLRHAFETLKFVRVQFTANVLNAQSRAGIEKIGGRFEGVLRNAMILPNGKLRDDAYYSVIASEWPTPSTNGPMAQIERAGQILVKNGYDEAGKLISTWAQLGGISHTVNMTYDGFNRRSAIDHSNGISGDFIYDGADRVSSIDWSGPSTSVTQALTYNGDGQVTQNVREIGTFNYEYSLKDEVTSIAYSGSETLPASVNAAITHSAGGNILSFGSSTFENLNHFVTKIGTATTYWPDYFGLGQMIGSSTAGGNTNAISYHPDGKIKQVKVYNTSTSALIRSVNYYYDGLDRRIAKTKDFVSDTDSVTTYTHLGLENRVLLADVTKSSTTVEGLYVDGAGIDDHLFEIVGTAGAKPYVRDQLGSVLNSAAIGGKSVYGLYGQNLGSAATENSGVEPLVYGFAGREYDSESGYYNFLARIYDPQSARFLTKDPKGPDLGGDINPYRYVLNNPVNLVDPDGREPVTLTMIAGGAIVGGVAAGATAYMAGADARTIAISAGIGAAAGAASLGVSAFASSATAIVGANVLIGGSANVATQVALGTPFSQVSLTSVAIGGIAGGVGAAAGLGAGTAAFYRTPVIGNAIGNAAARRSEFITSTILGTTVGTGAEAMGSCR